MNPEKIQQAYADKRAADEKSQEKTKSTEEYNKKLVGSDRIQRAIVETARLSIEHRDGHEPKVEVKNFPKSVKTPDIKEVVQAIDKMSKEVAPKNIDFTPLQKSIAALSEQIAKLPTEYPEAPEAVETVAVNNLNELKPQLEAITATLEKLKLDPKIDVKVPKTDLSGIESAIASLKVEPVKEVELSDYMAVVIDDDSEYMQYVGFINPDGEWYILYYDIEKNLFLFNFGIDNFNKSWQNHMNINYSQLDKAIKGVYGKTKA